VSDRVLRFPDRTWDELEALPQPLRSAAYQAIFHVLDSEVSAVQRPFVVRGGVEPPTFRFSGGRSYQLSYLTVLGAKASAGRS
jgi:hypothetical protein